MVKKIFVAVLFISVTCGVFAQRNNIFVPKGEDAESKITVTSYFGISLLTSYNGFIRYGYIQKRSTGEEKITYLSRQEFIQQISGQQESEANPEKKNYLAEYKIKWETFENLWKLRYSEYPYDGPRSDEKGWAGRDFAPSEAQWDFLRKNYNYKKFTQFLYGEDMWRLLKDSQDPNWQRQYSSLR
ncbi:MAG: hypothetical protein R6U95_02945 [Bacteroidales bacterium]